MFEEPKIDPEYYEKPQFWLLLLCLTALVIHDSFFFNIPI